MILKSFFGVSYSTEQEEGENSANPAVVCLFCGQLFR